MRSVRRVAGASRLSASASVGPLEGVQSGLRRVRLLGAAVVLVQLVGNRSASHGSSVAFAVGVLSAVAAVNLASLVAGRTQLAAAGAAVGVGELVADGCLTLYLVTGSHLLADDIGWALLVVPVLEGALRFRLRGAVLTWVGVAVVYAAAELSSGAHGVDVAAQAAFLAHLQAVIQRVSIVLFVAVPGGYLSDQLLRAIAAQRRARQEAATRNALLELVIDAGNRINRLGAHVVDEVVACAGKLGFAVVDICERDRRDGSWEVLFASSESAGGDRVDKSTDRVLPNPGSAGGGADLAAGEQATVIVDGADGVEGNEQERDALVASGLAAVVVTPLRGRDGSRTVLRGGLAAGAAVSTQQVECLELLAGQASVALANSTLVTQLRDARHRLEHQAFHDALTELPNRTLFHSELAEALRAPRRSGRRLAVLFLDLDRFKEVNDGLGHEMGDELLIVVARRLRSCLRSGTVVARNGGDEFTVLARVGGQARAEAIPARICKAVAAPVQLDGHEVSVSASVGIALADGDDVEPGELLRRADLAMYQAKAKGASRWHTYRPSDEGAALERMRLEADLRRALERNDLGLAYQPIVRPGDATIVGVEALLRWKDPERGHVQPDEFIPLAEDSGLIVELGGWVLREACGQLRRWSAEFPHRALSVSVNVSPRQLSEPGFFAEVTDLLARGGIDPGRLTLEITERVLAGEDAAELVAAIQALGVRVAVDDFGQGQASINYLQRFSVDVLKIDKSLVAESTSVPKSAAILRSIVGLAHELGIEVVVEGVETGEQLELVRSLACDAVQGFHLHCPVSPADITALLAGEGSGRPRPATRRKSGRHRRAPATATSPGRNRRGSPL